MSLVKLKWAQKTVPEKLVKGAYISQQMALNAATFVTPNPPLSDLDNALTHLNRTAIAAEAGGHALILAKNEAEGDLDLVVTRMVSYVQNISAGEESIILEAGMEVRNLPSPVPPPAVVQNLDAYPTRTQGQVQLNWDPLGKNHFYQVEQLLEDGTELGYWSKLIVSSKSKYLVTGLTTGTVYQFRVAGIGRNDEVGPYSQVASSVAP